MSENATTLRTEDTVGTSLYGRIIQHAIDKNDAERLELAHKVWDPTPWVIDVFVGRHEEDTEHYIRQWCLNNFGKESWPIHDNPADWYRGGATVNGWTWFGFKTEEMMQRFIDAWPDNVRDEHV